jgi:hypothetical protein
MTAKPLNLFVFTDYPMRTSLRIFPAFGSKNHQSCPGERRPNLPQGHQIGSIGAVVFATGHR